MPEIRLYILTADERPIELDRSLTKMAWPDDLVDERLSFQGAEIAPGVRMARLRYGYHRIAESGRTVTGMLIAVRTAVPEIPAAPAEFAVMALARLREHFPAWADDLEQHILKLAGEVGELDDAWMRYAGRSRRSGTLDEVAAEAADVLLTLHVLAECAGFALETLPGFQGRGPADRLRRIITATGRLADAMPSALQERAEEVLAALHVFAAAEGIDLEAAWKAKAAVIAARPWKEQAADAR